MLASFVPLIVLQTTSFSAYSEGDTWKGQSSYLFSDPQYPDETDLWVWEEHWKVIGASNGSITLARKKRLIENKMNGKPVPILPDLEPSVWRETWTPEGVTRDPEIDDKSEIRLWRLSTVPMAKQAFAWPGTLKFPSASAKIHKGELKYTEPSGIHGIGVVQHDEFSGWPLAGEVRATGVRLPGGDGSPFNLLYSWKTTEFKLKKQGR